LRSLSEQAGGLLFSEKEIEGFNHIAEGVRIRALADELSNALNKFGN